MSKSETVVRCKAFSGEPMGNYRIRISDGRVLVWDSVAGHYTAVHALSRRSERRIIKAIRVAAAA